MGHYREAKERMDRLREEYRSAKILARGSEEKFVYQVTRGAYGTQMISPWKGFASRALELGVHEIPPGHYKNTHRHSIEAIIYILHGSGFTIVDGERIDWQSGDAFAVPKMAWHTHHNPGPEPVHYMTLKNKGLTEALLLSVIEELGDAKHFASKVTVMEKYPLREMAESGEKVAERIKE